MQFDPSVITYDKLVTAAQRSGNAAPVIARTDRQLAVARGLDARVVRTDDAVRVDREPKYYLRKTPYRHVPMTSLQATRINAAIHTKNGDPRRYLSPRQRLLLQVIEKHPKGGWKNVVGTRDLLKAWTDAQERAARLTAP